MHVKQRNSFFFVCFFTLFICVLNLSNSPSKNLFYFKQVQIKRSSLYLQVWHGSSPNGINCQVRASKAHKIRLLREEAVSEQPPA